MRLLQEPLPGLKLIQLEARVDPRGFFVECFHEGRLAALGVTGPFVQDNRSRSSQGVLRGLHAQASHPQGKFVRAVVGEIFDVAVDARPSSSTFGRWFGCSLKAEDFQALYIPPGFFHGFCVLSPAAEIEYKCTDYYDRADEVGVLWNDPELGIAWPLKDPLLSDKDKALPLLAQVKDRLKGWK